jgi:hypothetical protein
MIGDRLVTASSVGASVCKSIASRVNPAMYVSLVGTKSGFGEAVIFN